MITYIAGGKAVLRDQRMLSWDKKKQKGTWRLLLLTPKAPSKIFLPSYGLQTVFDDNKNGPNATATGSASSEAHKSIRLCAAFDDDTSLSSTSTPGIVANHPHLLYVAQSRKQRNALSIIRDNNPQPVEELTEFSRHSGSVFLVLTLNWQPPKAERTTAAKPPR